MLVERFWGALRHVPSRRASPSALVNCAAQSLRSFSPALSRNCSDAVHTRGLGREEELTEFLAGAEVSRTALSSSSGGQLGSHGLHPASGTSGVIPVPPNRLATSSRWNIALSPPSPRQRRLHSSQLHTPTQAGPQPVAPEEVEGDTCTSVTAPEALAPDFESTEGGYRIEENLTSQTRSSADGNSSSNSGGTMGTGLEELSRRKMSPRQDTRSVYEAIRQMCRSSEGISKALELIEDRHQKGERLVAKHFHPILRELGRTRMVAETYALFRAMSKIGVKPNESTYGTVIYSFASVGWIRHALSLLAELKRSGLQPNSLSYNPIIMELAKRKRLRQALELVQEMINDGVTTDKFTYVQLIHGCAIARNKRAGLQALAMMREQGIAANDSLHASVIELLHKTSPLEEVSQYVSSLERRGEQLGVKAQGALVAALASSGDTDGAIRVYQKARHEGIVPFPYAIGAILFRLGQEGRIPEMVELFLDNMDPCLWQDLPWDKALQSTCGSALICITACLQHKDLARAVLLSKRLLAAKIYDERLLLDTILVQITRGPESMVRTLSPQDGLHMIEELKGLGLRPSRIGLEVLLDLCAEMGDLASTLVILRQLGDLGMPPTAFTLFRLFKVAVTVENEALACWVLGKMQKTDLNDRHVQLLVQKTLEPHVQRAAQYGMGEHPATLPNVRKVANSLLPYTLAHAP